MAVRGPPVVKVPKLSEFWLASLLILIAALAIAPGFFTIDEAIYYLGARAVAEHGALGLDNGFAQFQSEALKLKLLIDGPQGLTPQYPAGSALLAGLFLQWLGPRAFILLNAAAAVALLFTMRKICLGHFNDEKVARLAIALLVAGTFWAEYAVGIWPHMLAAYFVVQAYWFAQRHLTSPEHGYRNAILAGLCAGAGMLFRLDAVFAVPAIGLILILFAPRFMRSAVLFGLGVLPTLALSGWLNYLKFGSPNPFSYGQPDGNTNLAAYAPLVAALCASAAVLIPFRKTQWRIDRKVAIVSIAVLGASVLAIPATNPWMGRFWNGFMALIVDIRNVEDPRIGVQPAAGDTITFWDLTKKALGQSMPWIGILGILLTREIRKADKKEFAMLLLFMSTMMAPFILLSWHGGASSNMRYFLPVLPALCILCAKLLYDLWLLVPSPLVWVLAGVWGMIAVATAWVMFDPSQFRGVRQILPTYVLVATVIAAIMAGIAWRYQQAVRNLTIVLLGAGLLMAMTFAVSDFVVAARWRAHTHGVNEALSSLPRKSLVIAFPTWVARNVPGNDSILAERNTETEEIDQQLVLNALDAGYRVFVVDYHFDQARDVPAGVEVLPSSFSYSSGRLLELRHSREGMTGQSETAAGDPALIG